MQPRLVYNTPLYVASIIKQATNAIIHNSILQNIFFHFNANTLIFICNFQIFSLFFAKMAINPTIIDDTVSFV